MSVSRSVSSSIAVSKSCRVSASHSTESSRSEVAEALIDASGVRRSCETAARSADFSSSDWASADACAASCAQPGALQGQRCLIDEGRQRLLVFGPEDSSSGPARHLQHAGDAVLGHDRQVEDVGAASGVRRERPGCVRRSGRRAHYGRPGFGSPPPIPPASSPVRSTFGPICSGKNAAVRSSSSSPRTRTRHPCAP